MTSTKEEASALMEFYAAAIDNFFNHKLILFVSHCGQAAHAELSGHSDFL